MENEAYTLVNYIRDDGKEANTTIEWTFHDFVALCEQDFNEIRTNLMTIHGECDCKKFRHPKSIRLKLGCRLISTRKEFEISFLCKPLVPTRSKITYFNSSNLFTNCSVDIQFEHFNSGWQFINTFYQNEDSAISNDKSLKIVIQLKRNNNLPELENYKKTYVILPPDSVTEVIKGLEQISREGTHADVTFLSKEGTPLKAHRGILAARSEMLRAMFEHDHTKHEDVITTLLNEQILRQMLTFIYTGESPKTGAITADLFVAADYYQLPRLKTVCAEALCDQLTVENAIYTLELAERHNCKELLQPTLQYITEGLLDLVTKSEGWKNMQSANTSKIICEAVSQGTDPLESRKLKEKIKKEFITDFCISEGNIIILS